jgi:hypothetical protein
LPASKKFIAAVEPMRIGAVPATGSILAPKRKLVHFDLLAKLKRRAIHFPAVGVNIDRETRQRPLFSQ